MALPERIRVKLSSEAAGSIALTPVVAQELAALELIEQILSVTGKDRARIRDVLRRGTLVTGASRFRWVGWEADEESLDAALATFPDPDPSRPFAREHCVAVVLRCARGPIELPRAAGERKGLFQRVTCWERLMDAIAATDLAYAGYSYREHADRYTSAVTAETLARVRQAAELLRYQSLRDQICTQVLTAIEARVER
jgi:hypothetical protein